MTEIDIEFRGVSKAYGEVLAVDRVDLGIPKGAFVSLLGPSGCGKTTSLRIMAGFEQPSVGEVEISGRSVVGVPAYRRPVNMVFQNYALFPHLTVFDNVAFGLRQLNPKPTKRELEKQVAGALELVRLTGFGDRRIWELSGGQQQRVALARALINRPKVLLLDEPLAALDRKLRRDMQIELQNLQDTLGITFVLVTHDQEEALSIADRIVVMNQGVIEQVGTPLDIYREPASPFVADFVGKVNVLPARVAAGELRFGSLRIPCEGADREARVYLRPEDVLARPIADGDAHVFDARIEKIEFLGSYCHVRVASPALDAHKLTVYLSLNFLSEQSLSVGSPLKLKLLPERIKVF
jgi:iron(III) transport system ATP-binding protein